MATTTLKYGTYSHPLMPRVQIASSPLLDDGGAAIGYSEAWSLEGVLVGTDQADLATKLTALEAAYATEGLDLTLLASDAATVLRLLDASASVAGTQVSPISYPTGDGPELATKRTYTVTVTASFLVTASDFFDLRETTRYAIEQDGMTTRSVEGTLRVVQGVSANTVYTARDPGTPGSYIRLSESKRVNGAGNELTYRFVDRELFVAFPAGVLAGSATRSDKTDGDGVTTVSVRGTFIGSGATAAAAARKLSGLVSVHETVTVDPFTGEVGFVYDYLDRSGSNRVRFVEQVELSESYEQSVTRMTLGGPPVVQSIGQAPARAVQSGYALGRRGYPSFPGPLFAGAGWVGPPQLRRLGPEGTDGQWRIEWRYEFVFAQTPFMPNPRTN